MPVFLLFAGSLDGIMRSPLFAYIDSDIKYKITDIREKCVEPVKQGLEAVSRYDVHITIYFFVVSSYGGRNSAGW